MDTVFHVLDCSVCKSEIPGSEAISAEASDYVAYFCGLECYAEWREQQAAAGVESSAGADRQQAD